MFNQRPMLAFTPEEVVDYLRKSQSDDPLMTVEEVLAKHESILDSWAEQHLGGKVPEENKFREIVSGETLDQRPEIQRLLRLIESPKYKAVKVVDPQRLTRGDLEDIGRIMKVLKLTNTLVIVPDELGGQRVYDLRDEYDWNAFEAELKRGNDYLKYTKKILNRGRLLSVSQGNYLGSVPPYGFDKATVMDGKRKCPTLKENPEQADVVRMIFDLYVNHNMGRKRICNRLEELNIKPPKGDVWSVNSMLEMLKNVHYIGKVRWNWRKTITIVSDSEFIKTRPKTKIGEYLIYEGKHDGIIPEELFWAAQEKLGKNPRTKAKAKMRNPLAGVLYCQCGRAMVYQTYKHKNSPLPRIYCPEQSRCKTGSCTYDSLIDRVCQILQQCIEDFEIRIQQDEGDSAKLHAKLIKNLEKKLADLQAKELAQWELQADPDPAKRMPPAIFQQLNARLLLEKEEIQQALCKAYESMPEPVDYEDKVVRFTDALNALRDPEMDVTKQNALVKACIERIEYHREAPTRRTPEGNYGRANQWTDPPIELDVKLKV